jgi:DNA-binding GntR family transcriptional regulator
MKLDHSTLQEKVTSNLRKAILKKTFEPGERLVQEDLATILGVSRMPIREALRRLEMEGLVELVPHKGAVVVEITKEDIEEVYDLRSLLESHAVAKSLDQIKDYEINKLEQLMERMEKNIEDQQMDQFVDNNSLFHQTLRRGSSKRTEMIIQQLWNGYPPYVPSLLPETMIKSHEEHKLMLEAVKIKDKERLKQVMASHILRTGEALKNLIGKL